MYNIGKGVTPPSFALLVALLSEVWNNYREEMVEFHGVHGETPGA
jgi:hypothetical protein